MENLEENVYAKKYLVNYRYLSSEGKCPSFTQDFKCVNTDQPGSGDVNKNQSFSDREKECFPSPGSYQSHQCSSTNYMVENVPSDSDVPSLSSKHSLSDGDHTEHKLKKLKLDCFELEEVNDAGLCADEVSELENFAKLKSDLAMESFTDLSAESDLGWLNKVVAQDHSYHRRRAVQFSGVTVWYFGRQQYSSSVPTQGDVSLGMDWTHSHSEYREIDSGSESEEELPDNKRGRRKGRLRRLKALSLSARLSLLRSHGILQIDRRESADIERVQSSRATQSGCDCVGSCLPQTCSCAINQVQCEMDTEGFPCKCSHTNCCNPHGRRVFNRKEVDMHRWTQVDFNSQSCLSSRPSDDGTDLVKPS